VIRFCPSCASALPGLPPVSCGSCGYALFVNPRPTGLPIILDGDRVLVAVRAHEPRAGRWALPGGFCDGWETPASAAVREAREELGVDVELTGFVGMYLENYEYQGETLPVLDCFYTARIVAGDVAPNPRELGEWRWAKIGRTPPMAFETMQLALDEVARNLIGRD
jgi:ADP-ribose pyrophosphatase YjhB (NUDIX family)